jgi:enamine deaminase RidA (YjgF/YER057c/UK114 family)
MRSWPLALILAAGLSGTASAGERQRAKVLMPDDPAALKLHQDWGFAEAVISGDTVYLSGIVAGPAGAETDLRPAYDRAFRHIATILQRAGASWDDVVDITSFHTDLTTQMPAIIEVKNRFVRSPPPAWTAIGVTRLIPDRGITEIKIVARLPQSKP